LLQTLYPDGNPFTILWDRNELADSCAVVDDNGVFYYGANAFPPGTDGYDANHPPPRSPALWSYDLEAGGDRVYDEDETIHWPPAVGSDGTLFLAHGTLEALDQTFKRRWRFLPDAPFAQSPALGNDGTIFVNDSGGELYALSPDGALLWKQPLAGGTPPAIATDGTIFVGEAAGLTALAPDGSRRWHFAGDAAVGAPLVDGEGTVFYSDGAALHAVGADGLPRWTLPGTFGDLALAADGTLYAGSGSQLTALR